MLPASFKEFAVISFLTFSVFWSVGSLIGHKIAESLPFWHAPLGGGGGTGSHSGTIARAVIDYRGKPLLAAEVTIACPGDTAPLWIGFSDALGRFSSPALPSAQYDVAFVAPGHRQLFVRGVVADRER